MIIKEMDSRDKDIEALKSLLSTPGLAAWKREMIDQEIRTVRAGVANEKDAAHYIDFALRDRPRSCVLHDLRLDHKGAVAQIDHLIITAAMEFWVCESKSFAEGVAINDHGEFTAFYRGTARGVESPIEQNRRHIQVLEAMLRDGSISLPTRLGFTIRPNIRSLVLVSPKSRITRPSSPIDGIGEVIKADHIITTLWADENIRLVGLVKIVSPETLQAIASEIAKLHRPKAFDWRAKFGLPERGAKPAVATTTRTRSRSKPLKVGLPARTPADGASDPAAT